MVQNFKRVSAFSPLLVCSEHFTDVHLKMAKVIAFDDALYIHSSSTLCVDIMTRKGNNGQVGNSSTRATGYILCVEKTGSEFVLPISSPGLPINGLSTTMSIK